MIASRILVTFCIHGALMKLLRKSSLQKLVYEEIMQHDENRYKDATYD